LHAGEFSKLAVTDSSSSLGVFNSKIARGQRKSRGLIEDSLEMDSAVTPPPQLTSPVLTDQLYFTPKLLLLAGVKVRSL
jgi:hypothetical protein